MTASPTPQLILVEAEISQPIDLTAQKTWTLGRSSINSIVLSEISVSRHHAKLEVVGNRHCYFVDLNNSNGSQVNGKRVVKPQLLKHGDLITIGSTDLRFHFPFVTHSGSTFPFRPLQVFMIQESAIQGIIWQEIFCSQGFDVRWASSSTDLQPCTSADMDITVLPDLFLIDLVAFTGEALAFCAWCSEQHPGLPLFLSLNAEASASTVDFISTTFTGRGKILPALPSQDLCQNIDTFADQLRIVLAEVDGCCLDMKELQTVLCNLDSILERTNFPGFLGNQTITNNDLDELTILNHKKHP